MRPGARVIVLIGLAVAGCETAHNVVVSSYHAVTTPVRYVQRHVDSPPQTTTTTSDVVAPGHPVVSPTPQPRVARGSTGATQRTTTAERTAKAKPSPSPRVVSSQPQFPVAKAVPGKPGLVYNPFDPHGGYIDVSGYARGSKVKDPDSQKIFIVP